MKERRRFRPTTVDWLETRVVLNASGRHIAPVSAGHVTTNARNAATQAVVNNVNSSFDSFTTDYLQAQGTYFAAGATQGAHTAFRQYVGQRIQLLAAQLTQIFTHVPGSLNQSKVSTPGGPVILQTFLRSRIDGTSDGLYASHARRGQRWSGPTRRHQWYNRHALHRSGNHRDRDVADRDPQ